METLTLSTISTREATTGQLADGIILTDADFKAPTLSRVITIDDRYEDTMADVKGWIYDAERVQAGNGEALQVIASIYGDSYISVRRAEDGGNHAWENRTGERADRGATADRTEENTGITQKRWI